MQYQQKNFATELPNFRSRIQDNQFSFERPHLLAKSQIQKTEVQIPYSPTAKTLKLMFKNPTNRFAGPEVDSLYPNRVRNLSTSIIDDQNTSSHHLKIQQICNSMKEISTKFDRLNEKVVLIQGKLGEFEKKNIKKQTKFDEEIGNLIKNEVSKKVYEQQQHLILHNKLIKTELDTIKLQMRDLPLYQMQKRITMIQKQLIQELQEKIFQTGESLSNEISKLKIQLNKDKRVESIYGNLHKLIKIRFNLFEGGNPQQMEQVQSEQIIYGMDEQGFLMDSENRYLLDHCGHQIRLNTHQIDLLKSQMLLK